MNENINSQTFERLISIGRVMEKDNQVWLPSVKDEKEHEFDPMWVAATMFLIFDRYLNNIPDKRQNEFYESTLFYFDQMKQDGLNYLLKVNLEE